jgi:hypothetical protein
MFCASIRTPNGVDGAAKLNDNAVAVALHDAPLVERDGTIDQVTSECAKPSDSALRRSLEGDYIRQHPQPVCRVRTGLAHCP